MNHGTNTLMSHDALSASAARSFVSRPLIVCKHSDSRSRLDCSSFLRGASARADSLPSCGSAGASPRFDFAISSSFWFFSSSSYIYSSYVATREFNCCSFECAWASTLSSGLPVGPDAIASPLEPAPAAAFPAPRSSRGESCGYCILTNWSKLRGKCRLGISGRLLR